LFYDCKKVRQEVKALSRDKPMSGACIFLPGEYFEEVSNHKGFLMKNSTIVSTEDALKAVKRDPHALTELPKKFLTPELCHVAVQEKREALQYVPKKLKAKVLSRIDEMSA
jgi:hypothetical protein